jgi:hypothetical protein
MKKLTTAARHLGLTRRAGALLILVLATMAISTPAHAFSKKLKDWYFLNANGTRGHHTSITYETCEDKFYAGKGVGSYWNKSKGTAVPGAHNCKCKEGEGIESGKYVRVYCFP